MQAASKDTDCYVAVDAVAAGPVPADRRNDITIITNAVDSDRLKPTRSRDDVRASLGLKASDVAVLFLARLSEEKRPLRAVEAARKLPDGFVLLLAGDGPQAESVAKAAYGNPRVRLLGKRDDVGDVLSASDLSVSLSRTEGFGLSIAEAMLAGVPMVATPVGFLEHSPELARILPVDATATEWAEAIQSDWSNEQGRTERGRTAQTAISTQYGVASHVAAWVDYILNRKR